MQTIISCTHTNFGADLNSRIGHRFISRILIFVQPSKTNFHAYLFSRRLLSQIQAGQNIFEIIGFDRSFVNNEIEP